MKTYYKMFMIILIFSQFINCDDLEADLPSKDLIPIDMTTVQYDPLNQDEGIYPDVSVLINPDNPFVKSGINENSKWDINDGLLQNEPKYYLWATALAKFATGENQYYTAEAIRAIEGNTLRAQRAYEVILEHFYYDITFPGGGAAPVYLSSWACDILNTNFYSQEIMCP